MKANNIKGSIMLLLAAMIWGSAFAMQEMASNAGVQPFTFNTLRFFIGSAVLVPVIFIMDMMKKKDGTYRKQDGESRKRLVIAGVICGAVLCIAANLQQLGFALGTTSDKAGFITALYILIVPLIGLFTHRKVRPIIWACIAVAVVGLYLLCIKPGVFSVVPGDLLMFTCALAFAFHIITVDKFSPSVDGVRLSCLQFFVAGAIGIIPMIVFESPSVTTILAAWFPITYVGVLSCGVAYTFQILGQRTGLNPTLASLIMSFESVFSLVGDCIVKSTLPSPRVAVGAVLMFAAIILAQLPPVSISRKRR